MLATIHFTETCTINQLDQTTGNAVLVESGVRCSEPAPYIYRQNRAETAYDFQPVQVFTEVPEAEIEEGMRMVFADGLDLRIYSINPWPMSKPRWLEIILQGDGIN